MSSGYTEEAVSFDCEGSRLVGVLARPNSVPFAVVVMLVGGLEYRAGSHRFYVLLARALAEAGIATLRFDYRGMGDSDGEILGFDDRGAEINAALTEVEKRVDGVNNTYLLGLCDSATSALLGGGGIHDRVNGLILMNLWVEDHVYSLGTKLNRHYLPRLASTDEWGRLLRGEVRVLDAAKDVLSDFRALILPKSSESESKARRIELARRMARTAHDFNGRILCIESEEDSTAVETARILGQQRLWKNSVSNGSVEVSLIQGADHTFSRAKHRTSLERRLITWLRRGAGD